MDGISSFQPSKYTFPTTLTLRPSLQSGKKDGTITAKSSSFPLSSKTVLYIKMGWGFFCLVLCVGWNHYLWTQSPLSSSAIQSEPGEAAGGKCLCSCLFSKTHQKQLISSKIFQFYQLLLYITLCLHWSHMLCSDVTRIYYSNGQLLVVLHCNSILNYTLHIFYYQVAEFITSAHTLSDCLSKSGILSFWILLYFYLGSQELIIMENKYHCNSRAFAVIDTSRSLMKGKQREHTDGRWTIVYPRAEYPGSASTLLTLFYLKMGVKGFTVYTLEEWGENLSLWKGFHSQASFQMSDQKSLFQIL